LRVIEILVDADACPVKEEVYSVAGRYGLSVVLVANAQMNVPAGAGVEMIVVDEGPDVADDWIAANARAADVVVTADIPLAARCLEVGARVVGPHGREFTEDAIGGALATRELMSDLRGAGLAAGGPPPISQRDRSRFLSCLDGLVQKGLADVRR
jgi:uncharacterized protein YaiI (UPF0178 family)